MAVFVHENEKLSELNWLKFFRIISRAEINFVFAVTYNFNGKCVLMSFNEKKEEEEKIRWNIIGWFMLVQTVIPSMTVTSWAPRAHKSSCRWHILQPTNSSTQNIISTWFHWILIFMFNVFIWKRAEKGEGGRRVGGKYRISIFCLNASKEFIRNKLYKRGTKINNNWLTIKLYSTDCNL